MAQLIPGVQDGRNSEVTKRVSALNFNLAPELVRQLTAARKSTITRQTASGAQMFGKSYYVIDYDTDQRRMSKIRNSKASLSQRILDNERTKEESMVGGGSQASFGQHPINEDQAPVQKSLTKHKVSKVDDGMFRKQSLPEDTVTAPQYPQPKNFKAKVSSAAVHSPVIQEEGVYRQSKQSDFQKKSTIGSSKQTGSMVGRLEIPSPPKKKLTPINTDTKSLTSPTDCRPFYHEVCKRPSREGSSVSKSPKRKSPSKSPRGKDYYDKNPEFWVKQYRKIESMRPNNVTGGFGTDRTLSPHQDRLNATAPVRSDNSPIGWTNNVTQTQRVNSTLQRTVTTNSHHCSPGRQLPELSENQFCRFCDNYMHPDCFDKHMKRPN